MKTKLLVMMTLLAMLLPIRGYGQTEYDAGKVLTIGIYIINPIDILGFSLKVQISNNLEFVETGNVPKVEHGDIFNGHMNKQLLSAYDGSNKKIKIGYSLLEQNGVTLFSDTVLVCKYYVRCINSGRAKISLYEFKAFDSTGAEISVTKNSDINFNIKKVSRILMKIE